MAGGVERKEGRFDAIVKDLRSLRIDAGDVSYAQIAGRIAERRTTEGLTPVAAQVARSTVYDAFQPGRHRINASLVKEIVLALGASEADAESWRLRCLDARRDSASASAPATTAPPLQLAPTTLGGTSRHVIIIAIVIGCVGLNLFGGTISVRHHLPLFLDMIGTAAASFAFGPWIGAAVGVATNTLGALTSTPETIAFSLVNVTGAVLWGYGIRKWARTMVRLMLLGWAVALACTLVAVPLNVLLYDGVSGHASDSWIAASRMVEGVWLAVFSANFVVSLVDKTIASLIGLVLARLLIQHTRVGDATHLVPPLLRRPKSGLGRSAEASRTR